MEIGMHVYFEQRRGHEHGDNAIQVSMAKLADERIHERYMESEYDHIGEMNKVLSTSRNFLPDLPLTYDWQEGFYDPVFVNNWFFWMQEPFRLTDKILVCENDDRRGHLAYVVCYNNSYRTRKIMRKLSQNDSPTTSGRRALDKDNESNRFPHYGSKRHAEVAVNPAQDVMDNGPCCTMALFNFVANKGGSPTTKRILEDVSADRSAAEDNMILRSLHHYVLCGGHVNQEYNHQSASLSNDITMEGNHVVLITHFNGYVWEIDSAEDGGGAYCLGKEGTDWTFVAQKRLEHWTYAAWATQIHNDVHVIVAENSTI
ncbi:hypothetical protein BGZ81_000138 [Podila clonocystis]|nr:hypothetical protein BGZ81_000138 [Podila clonocystis]